MLRPSTSLIEAQTVVFTSASHPRLAIQKMAPALMFDSQMLTVVRRAVDDQGQHEF
jgi:hypothetical protein